MGNKSIAFKLIALVSGTCVVVFFLIFGFFYRFTRRMAWQDTEQYARQLAEGTTHRMQAMVAPMQEIPEELAIFLESSPCGQGTLLRLLQRLEADNAGIFAVWVAFEPRGFAPSRRFYMPYCYREGGQVKFKWLGGPNYRYFNLDFYQLARELGRPVWTEPYVDEGGGEALMASYCVPFYKTVGGSRRIAGVAGIDISLDWLARVVNSIKILKTGGGFLISKNGTYITHPVEKLIMNETIFSMAESRHDLVLKDIGRRMIRGETGFLPYRRIQDGAPSHLYFAPLSNAGWSLGVLFPDRELMANMRKLAGTIVGLGSLALLALILILASECRAAVKPLAAMARAAEAIAGGRLDVALPWARSRDEVGQLTEAFRRMRDSLQEYIRKLTETTAAKQRIESELAIARELQMSTLPKVFPPTPDLPEIEVHAVLDSAREVGGDFYDFYSVGQGKFCFAIGDVSGKGVPAALFMASVKTFLKSTAVVTLSPAAVLSRVNDELCEGNEQSMFATVFFAVLDVKTGELSYANGGHNPPVLLRRGGEPCLLRGGKGPALGAASGSAYAQDRLALQPGDRLFLYTDGVTEAMAADQSFFTEARMLLSLRAGGDQAPKSLVLGLLQEVEAFSQGEHSDDITMLALRYLGPAARV